MKSRQPVVAYVNQRLILMFQHEDCSEFKTRSTFDGRDFEHTAVAYQEGEAYFVLLSSALKDSDEKREVECAVFMNAHDAVRHAITSVANTRGWQRGG